MASAQVCSPSSATSTWVISGKGPHLSRISSPFCQIRMMIVPPSQDSCEERTEHIHMESPAQSLAQGKR